MFFEMRSGTLAPLEASQPERLGLRPPPHLLATLTASGFSRSLDAHESGYGGAQVWRHNPAAPASHPLREQYQHIIILFSADTLLATILCPSLPDYLAACAHSLAHVQLCLARLQFEQHLEDHDAFA